MATPCRTSLCIVGVWIRQPKVPHMKRLLGLLLVMGMVGCGGGATSPDSGGATAQAADADPVAALEKLGARIERNEQGEVIGVSIAFRKFTDADLVQLKGFAELQSLDLTHTQITDLGLVHLKGLTNLTSLVLAGTQVTDAGMVHLKGLTKLEGLTLMNTKITDAGLVHLKEMTKLNYLFVQLTKVTDAGVAELKQALPNCNVRN